MNLEVNKDEDSPTLHSMYVEQNIAFVVYGYDSESTGGTNSFKCIPKDSNNNGVDSHMKSCVRCKQFFIIVWIYLSLFFS